MLMFLTHTHKNRFRNAL